MEKWTTMLQIDLEFGSTHRPKNWTEISIRIFVPVKNKYCLYVNCERMEIIFDDGMADVCIGKVSAKNIDLKSSIWFEFLDKIVIFFF